MKPWFSESFEEQVDYAVIPAWIGDQPGRISIAPGVERELIFVDDRGFTFLEHEVTVDGIRSHYACLRTTGQECPLCARKNCPYQVSLFTVIQTRVVENESLVRIRNDLRVLAAQPYVASIIRSEKKGKGKLIGFRYTVKRASDHYDRPGEVFRSIGRVDLLRYGNPMPFDYRRIFAPLTAQELRELTVELE